MNDNILHVIVSASSWSGPKIKYRRHRLAEYLIQQEDSEAVIWIYPVSVTPTKIKGYLEDGKVMQTNPHIIENGVNEWALPDYVPGRYMKYKTSFGSPHFKRLIKYISTYQGKKVIWFAYPLYPYLMKLFNWDLIIYDCSDLWTEPSSGSRPVAFSSIFQSSLIRSAENEIINKSDIVFASSDYLANRILNKDGRQAITVENGVDDILFKNQDIVASSDAYALPRPRLGYVGGMRSKIDFEILIDLAKLNSGWSIVLAGPRPGLNIDSFEKLVKMRNVYWLGEVKQNYLPALMRDLDVGLLPYREIEYNKAVFPIKFFEYLSQGLPVAGCGIPSTKKYARQGIYLHVERSDFLAGCKKVLEWAKAGNVQYVSDRIFLAQNAVWENKLFEMTDKVKKALKKEG